MRFRAIDGSNDWRWGSGRSSYFTNQAAINANIRTRLQTFLGECFFSLKSGIDWWNLIGGKNPQAQAAIILQCRTSILNAYGVVRINLVQPVFSGVTRALSVTYNIDSIFTRNLSGSVQIER